MVDHLEEFYDVDCELQNTLQSSSELRISVENKIRTILHQIDSSIEILESDYEEKSRILQSSKKTMLFDVYKAFENDRQSVHFDLENKKLERHEFKKIANFIIDQFNRVATGEDIDFFDLKQALQTFETECERLKTNLPIYAYKSRIIELVDKNQVSIIVADTGSGKTTQISQYLYDANILAPGTRLVCTQPRKIAAMSSACRISEELGFKIGELVGYKAGMESKWSRNTKILFMTDHMLLNECIENENLNKYSCIIVDEAHERSIYTDLLLGLIKNTLKVRADLKVVITSATIDPALFVDFFQPFECPVLKIPGRLHPVEVIYTDEPPKIDNFFNVAIDKAIDLHCNSNVDDGAILVFLSTPSETEEACKIMKNRVEGLSNDKPCLCLPLHGRLEIEEQHKIFEDPNEGTRKVVFATNSAETSITIPNISMVIDTGFVKEATYDPKRNLDILSIKLITKSSADQRKGRAGRTRSGKCYRLYDKATYMDTMNIGSNPEILRVNLGLAFLKLYSLGVNPMDFHFVESPERSKIEETIHMLTSIGAVKSYAITELGLWVSKLPLAPYFSVFIHEAIKMEVGLEAIVISAIASLSGISLFYHGNASKENSEKLKLEHSVMKFCHPSGDIFTQLNVFREWIKQKGSNDIAYCKENSFYWKNLMIVKGTVREILHLLSDEFDINIALDFSNTSLTIDKTVSKLLCKTFIHNLCHYLGRDSAGYLIIKSHQRVHLFPSSSLRYLGANPEWIFFLSTMQTFRTCAINVQPIEERDIERAISEGWLDNNILKVKEKRLEQAIDTTIGSHIFSQFVGSCFRRLTSLEAKFQDLCGENEVVVIEAVREMGSIKAFTSDHSQILHICDEISSIIGDLTRCSLTDILEYDIGGKTRAVVQSGALIDKLLCPNENIRLLVFGPPYIVSQSSEKDVIDEFHRYGQIKSCQKFENLNKPKVMWGSIIFEEAQSAETALQHCANVRQNARLVVKLDKSSFELSNSKKKFEFEFSMEFSFGSNGRIAFVEFSDVSFVKQALDKDIITWGTPKSSIKVHMMKDPSKQSRNVIISDVPSSVSSSKLSAILCSSLSLPSDSIVTIYFQDIHMKFIKTLEFRCIKACNEMFEKGTYCLNIEPAKNYPSVSITGRFQDLSGGWKAFSMIKKYHLLPLKFDCSCAMFNWYCFLPTRHHAAVSCELDEILTQFTAQSQQQYDLQSSSTGFKLILFIKSNDKNTMNSFLTTKSSIESLIYIDELNCAHSEHLQYLFGKKGRILLDRIENLTNTWILTDFKSIHLKVHGNISNRIAAFNEIHKFQDEVVQREIQHLNLKAPNMPAGLAKRLLVKFGMNLEKYIEKSGLFNCEIDLKDHSLIMIGDKDSFNLAINLIHEEMDYIQPNASFPNMTFETLEFGQCDLIQECSVCLCPIDASVSYRLESCGHPYCLFCIVEYLHISQKDKAFPLICSREKCEAQYSITDLKTIEKMGFICLKDLIRASIEHFVAKNNSTYRFCCRPNCLFVYIITKESQKFECPICLLPQCSSCGIAPYHNKANCKMNAMKKSEKNSLENWLKKNPTNRKCCPSCSIAIEKLEGCNHVTCSMCHKHICWKCLKFFDQNDECYGHLRRVHGGIN